MLGSIKAMGGVEFTGSSVFPHKVTLVIIGMVTATVRVRHTTRRKERSEVLSTTNLKCSEVAHYRKQWEILLALTKETPHSFSSSSKRDFKKRMIMEKI